MNQPRMARCASLLQPWFDELAGEDFRRNATRYLQPGTHSATIAGRMDNLALTAKLFLNAQENRLPRITTIQVMAGPDIALEVFAPSGISQHG